MRKLKTITELLYHTFVTELVLHLNCSSSDQQAQTAAWDLIKKKKEKKRHRCCSGVSAEVQLWALRQIGHHGNWCWCGALWLDAGERALYLDRAEARAQGVNAHWCKQEDSGQVFGFFFLPRCAEAAQSLVCVCCCCCCVCAYTHGSSLRGKQHSAEWPQDFKVKCV